MSERNPIYQKLSDAVVNMDEEAVAGHAQEVVAQKLDAYTAIDQGLTNGMERAGKLFEEQEYFVPELIVCSDAMYAGLEILKPHLKTSGDGPKYTVVLGVIEGDTHDIGKNLVKIMMETGSFKVIDLGRDVQPATFVEAAVEHKADVIAISTLMTTTRSGMAVVIDILNQRAIRSQFKVIVGGGPISQAFADRISADGYAANASEAVRLLNGLLAVPDQKEVCL